MIEREGDTRTLATELRVEKFVNYDYVIVQPLSVDSPETLVVLL